MFKIQQYFVAWLVKKNIFGKDPNSLNVEN